MASIKYNFSSYKKSNLPKSFIPKFLKNSFAFDVNIFLNFELFNWEFFLVNHSRSIIRKYYFKKKLFLFLIIILILQVSFLSFTGCRNYDNHFDIAYFFKTEPEKTVIDFLEALNQKDVDYIYSNLLLSSDKNSISREKYTEEFNEILGDVSGVRIVRTVYLGYENEMSKVVAEFEVIYQNDEIKEYKKYFYLVQENNLWKIIFEKTFI